MVPSHPFLLVSILGVVGCSALGVEGPQTVRGPAILVHFGQTATITLPASAGVDEPVSMLVTSFGGGCIAKGEVELILHGLEAEVRPYRYETVRLPPNMACTDDLRIYQHTVTLQFAAPGDARVLVRGLQRPSDTPYTLKRTLTILP